MSRALETNEELHRRIEHLQEQVVDLQRQVETLNGGDGIVGGQETRLTGRQLAAHVKKSPLAMVEWDRDFRIRQWSRQCEKLFGWTADEMLGKHWEELQFVHEADRERVGQVCAGLIDGPEDHNVCSNRNYHRNGDVLCIQWFTSVLRCADGQVDSMVSFCLDVTDRVRAEQALRESEARFTLAVKGSLIGVWEWDIRTGKLYWSARVYEQMGFRPYEVVPSLELFFDVLHPDDRERTRQSIDDAVNSGDECQMEFRLRQRGADYRWFRAKGAVEFDVDRVPTRMAGCMEDIEDQKQSAIKIAQTHTALNEIHLRQKIALDAGGIGTWEYDVPADRVYADERLIQILMIDQDVVTSGIPLSYFVDTIHEDDRERIKGVFSVALRKGGTYTIECRVRVTDAQGRPVVRWVVSRGCVELNEDGVPVRALGALVDISDRRRAEDALADSEFRLRLIFDQQFQFTAILSAQGIVLDINDLALRSQGVERSDYIGKLFWLSPAWQGRPDWQNQIRDNVIKATNSLQPVFSSDQYRAAGGEIRFADASYTAIRDEHSQVRYVFVQATDVTERKPAQEELEETRAILSAAVDASPAGIIIADAPDGRIHLVNSAALGIRGGGRDLLVDIPIELHPSRWNCFYPDGTPYDPSDLPLSRAIINGDVSHNVDVVIQRDDGVSQWVMANAAPVKNAEDQIIGGVVVFSDVTEQRKAADALRDLEAELAHVARVSTMSEMVGGIAHDMNQPLYAIQNFSKASIALLEGGRELNRDQITDWLHQITDAAEHAGSVLVSLRRFVSRWPTKLAPTDLGKVLNNAIALIRFEVQKRKIVVRTRLSDGLPMVHADEIPLQQVIINLLWNSIEAIPESFEERQIDISATQTDNGVRVSIADSGTGLPDDWDWKLFRAFSSTKPDGLGLGLAIARTIIESHGGELWASEAPERGAVFNFTLDVSR